jgi:hypothetical protein
MGVPERRPAKFLEWGHCGTTDLYYHMSIVVVKAGREENTRSEKGWKWQS